MTMTLLTTDIEPDLLAVGPGLNGISLTPEEFDAADFEEGYSYELIRGVLVVNPIPSEAEVGPSELLAHWLLTYQSGHPQGSAMNGTLGERHIRLPGSRRRADRVIWAGLGRHPNGKLDVPTIAVEFVSRGLRNWQRDYIAKRDEYLAAGIREYWVIDRFQRTLTVFRTTDQKLEQQVFAEDAVYQPALLPGFELPLKALLRAADRWADD